MKPARAESQAGGSISIQGESMNALFARLRVVATQAVTYLVALGAVVAIVIEEVSKNLPEGWQDNAVQIGGTIASIIAAAVAIIRRVTPVLPQDKGLLPPDRPADPAIRTVGDVGAVNVSTLLCVLAFVCFVIFGLIAHGTFTSDEGFTWLGGGLALWVAASFTP